MRISTRTTALNPAPQNSSYRPHFTPRIIQPRLTAIICTVLPGTSFPERATFSKLSPPSHDLLPLTMTISAEAPSCNMGRGAYDTTGVPKPPPPKPR
ncbi:hypothetical protein BUE80_DR009801 [Diplocarpon rosae]|nr:hypothetical protein BUE80_DR009801 [Diplocarpon rosae]